MTLKEITLLMRYEGYICRNCRFSTPTNDHEDGYYCKCRTHNSNYLVMSGDYCSDWQSKESEKE